MSIARCPNDDRHHVIFFFHSRRLYHTKLWCLKLTDNNCCWNRNCTETSCSSPLSYSSWTACWHFSWRFHSCLKTFLFLKSSPHSCLSLPQLDLLALWPVVVWQSLAIVVLAFSVLYILILSYLLTYLKVSSRRMSVPVTVHISQEHEQCAIQVHFIWDAEVTAISLNSDLFRLLLAG